MLLFAVELGTLGPTFTYSRVYEVQSGPKVTFFELHYLKYYSDAMDLSFARILYLDTYKASWSRVPHDLYIMYVSTEVLQPKKIFRVACNWSCDPEFQGLLFWTPASCRSILTHVWIRKYVCFTCFNLHELIYLLKQAPSTKQQLN